MADEQKKEDATKELRAQLSAEMEELLKKYEALDVFFLCIDPNTGAFGYGGTMCPVCASRAMLQAVMRFNIQHTNPDHQRAEEEIAKQLLGRILGPMSVFPDDDEDVIKH